MLEKQYVVASFLHKLWSMLEDNSNANIISWSEDGTSFIVHDQAQFSMEVLPKFYKHNNMASFIRQLNMYGFSKISHDPSHNALYSVKHAESNSVEFHHPQFLRGQPELVASIKRKSSTGSHVVPAQQQQVATQQYQSQDLQNDPMAIRVLSEVQQLHKKQDSFSSQLEQLRHENEVLWRDMATLRQKCQNQQAVISKVVNFLVSVIGNGGSGLGVASGSKRAYPMIEADRSRSAGADSSTSESSPAKCSKLYKFPKGETSNNGGVTIQEITEDDVSNAGSACEASQPQFVVEQPQSHDALSVDSAIEPPVKIVPLPATVSTPGSQEEKPSPSSSVSPGAYQPVPVNPFNGDEFNHHLDNMQIDLEQLRHSLREYFSNNNSETTESFHQFNDDFLTDLFSPDHPLPELESPLGSGLVTPITSPRSEEANGKSSANQLVKYLPPQNYLVSGSSDPLLLQPSTSNVASNSDQKSLEKNGSGL